MNNLCMPVLNTNYTSHIPMELDLSLHDYTITNNNLLEDFTVKIIGYDPRIKYTIKFPEDHKLFRVERENDLIKFINKQPINNPSNPLSLDHNKAITPIDEIVEITAYHKLGVLKNVKPIVKKDTLKDRLNINSKIIIANPRPEDTETTPDVPKILPNGADLQWSVKFYSSGEDLCAIDVRNGIFWHYVAILYEGNGQIKLAYQWNNGKYMLYNGFARTTTGGTLYGPYTTNNYLVGEFSNYEDVNKWYVTIHINGRYLGTFKGRERLKFGGRFSAGQSAGIIKAVGDPLPSTISVGRDIRGVSTSRLTSTEYTDVVTGRTFYSNGNDIMILYTPDWYDTDTYDLSIYYKK